MMKINVLEERENPFLKRKDMMLVVDHTGTATPKIDNLRTKLAEQFKADAKKIEIVYILSQRGEAKSKVKAKIWKDKIVVQEEKKEEKREPQAEEVKPEEKPKEPKKEEKPKEEAKTEKPQKEEKPKEKEEAKTEKKEQKPKQEKVEEKKDEA